jgi:hypothetical protein
MTPADTRVAIGQRQVQSASAGAPSDLLGPILYIFGSLRHRPAVRERLGRLSSQLTIA